MPVKPIPDGYHSVTPYLTVRGVPDLLAFLKGAFHADERYRLTRPDGTIVHAEVRIGDSVVMLAEACGAWPPMPGVIYLYVEDMDAVYRRTIQAGAAPVREPADQFYGDRNAGVKDASGNLWWIATHVEDVSHEEIARCAQAQAKD